MWYTIASFLLTMDAMISLRTLNAQQRKAARAIDGPLLVLSGAGTGKTRTITYRIAHMLGKGIPATDILAVTFTNKAAREMAARVKRLVGKAAEEMQVSTFHSFGLRIARENSGKLGLRRSFSVYDANDQIALVRKALRSVSVAWKTYKPADILYAMNRLRVPTAEGIEFGEVDHPDAAVLEIVWKRYHAALRASNAVDFEDLLLLPLLLFKEHPSVLRKYRKQFRYVLVDEYQDTNAAQFQLVRALAKRHRNICVVGDDDQSIYGWRGAEVRNILDFEKHFPGATVVRLEQNYRSTGMILSAANAIIRKNAERKPKKLWTRLGIGARIRCLVAPDEMGEAEMIVSDILAHRSKYGHAYSSYAILMRMNAQARPFEDVLRRYRVPYVVVGGMQFYDRKEIRDFLAYLRLLVNHEDEEAFLRIINAPPRGIGDVTLAKLNDHAAKASCGLYNALATVDNCVDIQAGARKNLRAFYEFMEVYRNKCRSHKPSAVARELWENLGYERELQTSARARDEIDERMANVDALIEGIAYYERRAEAPTLEEYLRQVALLNEDDDEELQSGKLPVMTIHSAKGLEFDNVYLVGVEQGIMPHEKSVVTVGGEAEERRLFYVAVTRAKQNLTISYSRARTRYGKTEGRKPSQFLADMPENTIEWREDAYDETATEEEAADYISKFRATLAGEERGDI